MEETNKTNIEESKKTISLVTPDKKILVEKAVAMEMVTLKIFLDASDDDSSTSKLTSIPVTEVSSKSLDLLVTYIENRLRFQAVGNSNEIKAYTANFSKNLNIEELLELLLGVNYLDVEYMRDFLTQEAADRIANKSTEYVRALFNIESDFTKEEEENLRKENPWAYEGVDPD